MSHPVLATVIVALWFGTLAISPSRAANPTLVQLRQFTIPDRAAGLEWLRCSVGQTWNGVTCIGTARMLTLEEAEQAARMASRELGGTWRLPTVDELKSLVCANCPPPKIDSRLYPNTMASPYWSSSKNKWSVGRYWTVSFYTGYTFGRNAPSMARHVRLVRDLERRSEAKLP